MNIAMFGHKRIPGREGGVEVVVTELASRMAERGYSVTCYNRSGKKHIKHSKDNINLRIKNAITLNFRGMAALTSSFSAAISSAFGKYDVVHIHAEGPAATCLIPKLFGKKVIVTVHGLDWKREKWGGLASKYIKWGEKQAVKYADHIIVLSRNVQEYFKVTYNREVVYIPNGISKPDQRTPHIVSEMWGLEKDEYVLFVGRLVPEKGLRDLIEAWNGIKTDKRLVIVGESSDTDQFEKEIRKLAGDNILFTGFQKGQALEELYSNAYFYVLPSELEGMPLSLLEAMSYGNCCIVSDIPECTEVIEDKAITFHKSDVNDLRNAMESLLSDKGTVERYREVARNYICGKFNWDEVVDQTLEIYKR